MSVLKSRDTGIPWQSRIQMEEDVLKQGRHKLKTHLVQPAVGGKVKVLSQVIDC